jgi:chromosomal replication initiation ATPase DnaA
LSPCLPPSPLRDLRDLRGSPLLTQLWDAVQAALRLQITRSEFDSAIRCAQLHAIEAGVATIIVPTAQIKDRVETCLLPQLRDLLTQHVGTPITVRLILSGACPAAP